MWRACMARRAGRRARTSASSLRFSSAPALQIACRCFAADHTLSCRGSVVYARPRAWGGARAHESATCVSQSRSRAAVQPGQGVDYTQRAPLCLRGPFCMFGAQGASRCIGISLSSLPALDAEERYGSGCLIALLWFSYGLLLVKVQCRMPSDVWMECSTGAAETLLEGVRGKRQAVEAQLLAMADVPWLMWESVV